LVIARFSELLWFLFPKKGICNLGYYLMPYFENRTEERFSTIFSTKMSMKFEISMVEKKILQ